MVCYRSGDWSSNEPLMAFTETTIVFPNVFMRKIFILCEHGLHCYAKRGAIINCAFTISYDNWWPLVHHFDMFEVIICLFCCCWVSSVAAFVTTSWPTMVFPELDHYGTEQHKQDSVGVQRDLAAPHDPSGETTWFWWSIWSKWQIKQLQ